MLDLSDPQARELLETWRLLSEEQRKALLRLAKSIADDNDRVTRPVQVVFPNEEDLDANDTDKEP